MIDIQRYSTYKEGMSCPSLQGEFVRYEDHLAIVERLKQELQDELEEAYNRGYDEGHSEGYANGMECCHD